VRIRRGGNRWGWRGSSLLLGVLLLSGCAEETWWDARGSWSGLASVTGMPDAQRTSSVSDPEAGSTEADIELCQAREMVIGLSFVPFQVGRPAAVEIQTARPLCQEGPTQITGGAVMVWSNPGSDPNVVAAVRSDAWTVTGEINVTDYLSQGLPDLDAGETADTERVDGTFSLTATDGTGSTVRIQGGTFQLTVIASRVRFSPS
jgi:hypothetical protein